MGVISSKRLLLNNRISITPSEPNMVKPNKISGPHPMTGEHWWGPIEDSHIDSKPKALTINQLRLYSRIFALISWLFISDPASSCHYTSSIKLTKTNSATWKMTDISKTLLLINLESFRTGATFIFISFWRWRHISRALLQLWHQTDSK